MGTTARVIEEHPNYEIVELGGRVNYSQEFRIYVASLPMEEAWRIVNELEHQHRVRRIVNFAAHGVDRKEGES